MMNIPYNNYKTQLCSFWVKGGKCKFSKNCSYAHGEHELRKPYEPFTQPPADIRSMSAQHYSAMHGQYKNQDYNVNQN